MARRPLPLIVALVIPLLAACQGKAPSGAPAPAPAAPASGSLYHRIGGYDALAAVVDDFLGRMLKDPGIEPFFHELQPAELQRVRQMLVDQLCEATGGPCVYVGKDMRTVHTGLGITEADWNKAVGHLTASLNAFHVPAKEQGEILGAVAALKDQIVGQEEH
jgi:hemoglobin